MLYMMLEEIMLGINPSVAVTAAFGLLLILGLFKWKLLSHDNVLPRVRELKGIPLLGAMPLYLKHGGAQFLSKLIAIGDNGISYANIAGIVLISVHDPAMARKVLAYPEEIASR